MAVPSSIINLDRWKLTLPTGKRGNPTEVRQPKLNSYSGTHFSVSGSSVIFTAPVTGVTTSGSNYPRSELREMKAGGTKEASWSNKRKTRTMEITQAILEIPSGNDRGVVAGQIHGGSDDVTALILRADGLLIRIGDKRYETVDAGYVLGTYFTFQFKARPGGIEYRYNGSLVFTLPGNFSGCYFKAGCYTQANKSNGGGKGQVAISALSLDGAAPLALPPEVAEDEPRASEPEPPPVGSPCG